MNTNPVALTCYCSLDAFKSFTHTKLTRTDRGRCESNISIIQFIYKSHSSYCRRTASQTSGREPPASDPKVIVAGQQHSGSGESKKHKNEPTLARRWPPSGPRHLFVSELCHMVGPEPRQMCQSKQKK